MQYNIINILAAANIWPILVYIGHSQYNVLASANINPGACPGFLKGGGSNISWFPKKRSSDFKRGGVQWSDGGGVQYISLPRTTNLAYLDPKE